MVDKKLLIFGGIGVGVIAIIAVIGIITLIAVGCFAIGAMNVNEKNTVITSWNSLAESQKSFDSKAAQTLTLFSDHFNTYQSIITQSSPNYDLLKSNFETDSSNFGSWDSYLDDLNSAITDYSGKSTSLTGDSKLYASDALSNMRTYHTEMQKAQLDYIAFCNDMVSYIDSAQRGSPDQSMLQMANSKKDDANLAIQNAAAASNQAMDSIKRLQAS